MTRERVLDYLVPPVLQVKDKKLTNASSQTPHTKMENGSAQTTHKKMMNATTQTDSQCSEHICYGSWSQQPSQLPGPVVYYGDSYDGWGGYGDGGYDDGADQWYQLDDTWHFDGSDGYTWS